MDGKKDSHENKFDDAAAPDDVDNDDAGKDDGWS